MESRYLSFVMKIRPDESRKIFLLRRDGQAIPVAESFLLESHVELIWEFTERHPLEAQKFLLEDSALAETGKDVSDHPGF